MIKEKGSSIGEKCEEPEAEVYSDHYQTSKELDIFVSKLIDSAHGKCASPSIIGFVERIR